MGNDGKGKGVRGGKSKGKGTTDGRGKGTTGSKSKGKGTTGGKGEGTTETTGETKRHALAITRRLARFAVAGFPPLEQLKARGAKFFARVEKKLDAVPPEQRQPPPATIALPAALQYVLLGEGVEVADLREMFENLLVTSMDRDTAASAHPAFISMISQLTPDEARILKSINRTVVATQPHQFGFFERLDADSEKVGGEYISTQFERFCTDAGVTHPSLSGSYLDNLLRLKLLKEDISTEGRFHPEDWNDYGEISASVTTMTTRLIQSSEFGERFLKACVQR
jgi:hypothetical protein